MRCERCREALSARLDGEDGEDQAAERDAVDRHLATCAGCRSFLDGAARVTRLARTGVADPGPDLVDAVLAAAPRSRRGRIATVARVLIALVGAGQLALAAASLLAMHGWAAHGDPAATLGGATLAHMSHEAAAWNVAVGVGFLWAALRSSRSTGLVPMLSAFVAILTLLSVVDLLMGRVDAVRLLSHLLIVLGLGLVLLRDRIRPGDGGFTPARRGRRGDPPTAPGERDEPDPVTDRSRTGLRPTARHRAA